MILIAGSPCVIPVIPRFLLVLFQLVGLDCEGLLEHLIA